MTDPNLLRPINNVSIFSKLIEKALNIQLTRHIMNNNLVSQHLQGGLKGRNSTLNVLSIHERLAYFKKHNLTSALIASDQLSAYKTVNLRVS